MHIIDTNKTRMSRLSSSNAELFKQVQALDWDELESALNECVFKNWVKEFKSVDCSGYWWE